MNTVAVLKKYWGYTKFRLKQEEIIKEILSNKDTLALLPTGGGKSICYQLPALIKEGICIVITPLISLMDDQIRHLKSKAVKSVSISNEMNYTDIDSALTNCIYGGVKFLFLSPEKLQNNLVINRIKKMNVNIITVDEAHCISEWGHNFRPAYRKISTIREIVAEKAPILALTATATNEVINDIQNTLCFKKTNVIKSSFVRKKISYVVDNTYDKKSRLLKLVTKIKSSAIVYVDTRKQAKEISDFLKKNKFSSTYYHAGLDNSIRRDRQDRWTKNQIRIIVATSAFGMGINKLDVKLVVHMYLPKTIETYFQEAGRAGRDNNTAYAFLLANKNDIENQKKLLKLRYPEIHEIITCYQNIANFFQIAEGEMPKEPIPFDIESFNLRYKLNNIKTNNIIKYLEKEEKIKLSNNNKFNSKLKFSISKSELYKFQITNKFYDAFIKIILRNYNNIFYHFVFINEFDLAKQINLSIDKVKKILNQLNKLEVLEYREKNDLNELIFLQPRQDLNEEKLNRNIWKKRQENEYKKLNKIVDYIENTTLCRSIFLLNYFGEKTTQNCEVCDICIFKKREKVKNKKL